MATYTKPQTGRSNATKRRTKQSSEQIKDKKLLSQLSLILSEVRKASGALAKVRKLAALPGTQMVMNELLPLGYARIMVECEGELRDIQMDLGAYLEERRRRRA